MKRLLAFWILTLLSIALCSILGRDLENAIRSHLGGASIKWVVGSALSLLFFLGILWLIKKLKFKAWFACSFILVSFIMIQLWIEIPAERFHFFLFGILGFLNASIFGLLGGGLVTLVASAADEGLQHLLPHRVGEWRDVGINILACGIGMVTYLFGSKFSFRNFHSKTQPD